MSKAKILFLGPLPPPYMGPTLATEIILRSKINEDFNIIHLDTSDHRGLETLGKLDIPNLLLPIKQYFIIFYNIIREWPDIVYIPISQTTLGYVKDSGFIIITKVLRRKVICHLRGGNFKNWLEGASRIVKWYVRQTLSLVDGQIVLGETLRSLFEGVISEEKIFVVPNGRDFSHEFIKERSDTIVFMYLSNFHRSKGILEFLYAVPLVSNEFPNVEFVFAGEEVDQELASEINDFLRNNSSLPIRRLGPVQDQAKYQALSRADVFVYPTFYPPEGHPWVIVEAMAAGLPVISCDQGAIAESVIDGVNGFVAEKQNVQAIAEKMKVLILDGALRRKMGRESRRIYEEKYTETAMITHLSAVFISILDGNRERCGHARMSSW